MPEKKEQEEVTLADRLAQLPPSEHAILLNRFKFLSLVQRVAAADVAEMINTVGLEALTYKMALERFPAPPPKARGKSARRVRSPPGAESLPRARHTARRFRDREAERQFVDRMSRPARRSEAAAFSAVGMKSVRETEAVPAGSALGENEWSMNYREDAGEDSDAVVMDYSSDGPLHSITMTKAAGKDVLTGSIDHRQRDHEPQQQQQRPPIPEPLSILRKEDRIADDSKRFKEHRDPSQVEDSPVVVPQTHSGTFERYGEGSLVSPVEKAPEKIPLPNAMSPSGMSNANFRSRGHFAPKAKPKAATDTPRVPLEVIRHASALIARKAAVNAATRQAISDVHPPFGSGQLHTTPGESFDLNPSNQTESRTQSQLQETGGTMRSTHMSREDEVLYLSQGSHGERPGKGSAMHSADLRELTSCIERMLQDHRTILDGIVKDESVKSAERTPPSRHMSPTSRTRRETMAPSGDVPQYLNIGSGGLDDLSDEEDELLLINRIERSVGAMDRELEVIARDEHRSGEGQYTDEDLNEDEKKAVRDALAMAKGRTASGQRVVIVEPKENASTRGVTKRRRRGEMPIAIVERLRSFQTENHDYIRYTEKMWNNSHVTEQVFAQRLTENLLSDAFNEVFGEVSTILDDYVEGLAEHELQ